MKTFILCMMIVFVIALFIGICGCGKSRFEVWQGGKKIDERCIESVFDDSHSSGGSYYKYIGECK